MRISDWSSDVCSSDLLIGETLRDLHRVLPGQAVDDEQRFGGVRRARHRLHLVHQLLVDVEAARGVEHQDVIALKLRGLHRAARDLDRPLARDDRQRRDVDLRSEEHTSELQSLMRISYAVFCLKKKNKTKTEAERHQQRT